jgi:hypothetical protein
VRTASDDLRIDLYPGADGRFCLHDGTKFAWDEAGQTLTITGSPVERQVSARRVGVEPGRFSSAVCGGMDLPVECGSLNGEEEYDRVAVGQETIVLHW